MVCLDQSGSVAYDERQGLWVLKGLTEEKGIKLCMPVANKKLYSLCRLLKYLTTDQTRWLKHNKQ
jgi:hypothetical protein